MTEDLIDEGIEDRAASPRLAPAEKAALDYAELMATAPEKIDAAVYDGLAEHYTAAEIVELGAFVGFNIGYHTFFGTLDFFPMFSPDGRLVDQDEARRIYGDRPVSLQAALPADRALAAE